MNQHRGRPVWLPVVWLIGLLAIAMGVSACSGGGASTGVLRPPTTTRTSSTPSTTRSGAPVVTKSSARAVVLIVDGSGSMKSADGNETRAQVAISASSDLVKSLENGTNLSVLTYGTKTGSSAGERTAGCQDVSVLSATAPLGNDRQGILAALSGIAPRGYTPIGATLNKAAGELPDYTGSIVLLSDGEDTCSPPDPCKTARSLHAAHPGLTISTVGFRTDTAAGKQLACIASSSGGLFVTAANAQQLTTRLTATTDLGTAQTKLTSTGVGSAQLGQTYPVVQAGNDGFPAWSTGTTYARTLPGVTGTLTVIVWRDCSYIFNDQKTLVALQPTSNQTIDNVGPGSTPTQVATVYGKALGSTRQSDGTYAVLYPADDATGSRYEIIYSNDPASGGTVVKVIYLCTCKEPVSTPTAAPTRTTAAAPISPHYPAGCTSEKYDPAQATGAGVFPFVDAWKRRDVAKMAACATPTVVAEALKTPCPPTLEFIDGLPSHWPQPGFDSQWVDNYKDPQVNVVLTDSMQSDGSLKVSKFQFTRN